MKMKIFFKAGFVSVLALFAVSSAEARSRAKVTVSSDESIFSSQNAEVISGTLGAVSGFTGGGKTSKVGYAGSAVPIIFALANYGELSTRCDGVRTRNGHAACADMYREADERLGEAIMYATPIGDVKELVEGLETGNPKRVVCGAIDLAGWASPAKGVSIAGGVCSLFDIAEAASGEDVFDRSSSRRVVVRSSYPSTREQIFGWNSGG